MFLLGERGRQPGIEGGNGVSNILKTSVMDNAGKMSGTITRQWFLCQEKEVFEDRKQKCLVIGMPNELQKGENRICLTPESVQLLVDGGNEVRLQRGAGNHAHYTDREYADAGALIVESAAQAYAADVVIKPTSVSVWRNTF